MRSTRRAPSVRNASHCGNRGPTTMPRRLFPWLAQAAASAPSSGGFAGPATRTCSGRGKCRLLKRTRCCPSSTPQPLRKHPPARRRRRLQPSRYVAWPLLRGVWAWAWAAGVRPGRPQSRSSHFQLAQHSTDRFPPVADFNSQGRARQGLSRPAAPPPADVCGRSVPFVPACSPRRLLPTPRYTGCRSVTSKKQCCRGHERLQLERRPLPQKQRGPRLPTRGAETAGGAAARGQVGARAGKITPAVAAGTSKRPGAMPRGRLGAPHEIQRCVQLFFLVSCKPHAPAARWRQVCAPRSCAR